MAYRSSYDSPFGGLNVTPWVKRILLANVAVFLAAFVLDVAFRGLGSGLASQFLALDRSAALVQPWTLLTYAFVHAGPMHLLFNMLVLFFFGPPLEERWGGTAFAKFYAVAAVGGALAALLAPNPVVGASAAVNGVMLAYAMAWPDNTVYFWGIFPIKVKWLVLIMATLSFLMALGGGGGGTSHLAHLGGFAAAFLYLKSPWAPSPWGPVPAGRRKTTAVVAWKAPAARKEAAVRSAGQQPVSHKEAARMQRELLDDVDRILDKISTNGLGSLSDAERERLNEVSKRYRTN
jgi:membrane associated rhomboid family serine protease